MVFLTFVATVISGAPIEIHDTGVHYAPAASYAYAPAPVHSYAVAHAPIVHTPVYKHVEVEPYDPNPEYSFSYGVNDPETGDNKHAQETLKNGVVHGSYSLTEPDGSIRKVTYTADKINGFNAIVEKSGGVIAPHPHPLKYVAAAAPVYHAAPLVKYVQPAPIYHAAPVAKIVAPAYHAPLLSSGYTSYH